MLKIYRVGLDVWALVLFLFVMAPNFYWFAFEAPNDVLRGESVTPFIDMIASVSQIIMVAALCMIRRRDIPRIKWSGKIMFTVLLYLIYLCMWLLYYRGDVSSLILIAMCLVPCLSFWFYAWDRKNVPAMIPLAIFTVCHVAFGIVNFI